MSMIDIDISDFGLAPCAVRSVSIGAAFGRLSVLAFGKKGRRVPYAVCRCECGNVSAVAVSHLVRGMTKSCGCYRAEGKFYLRGSFETTHGYSRHRLYGVWRGMMQRCYNPTHAHFHSYGGRGIRVCARWQSIENFVTDMDAGYKSGLTLDRKNNNRGYSKGNCKWSTPLEQGSNTRVNRFVEYAGRVQTIAQWAREAGVTRTTMGRRIDKGLPPLSS